jgi:FkbM family methyltransferase
MHKNEFSDSSSLLEMADLHKQAFPFTARETLETVAVKRLDEAVEGLPLQDDILIKMDTQGYEDRVIAGG